MKQQNVFPTDNPFSYLWNANCVLYSVVIAFLLNKGWKRLGPKRPWGCDSKQHMRKRVYQERASELRKKISIAKVEVERLKENRKLTKRAKRNREILRAECRTISVSSLVGYMERQKSLLRKLKKGFVRGKRQEEARMINWQFKVDASRVYADMREALAKDKESDRPKYTGTRKNGMDGEEEMFNNIEEASSFWKSLWEENGTGNGNAEWLNELRTVINECVPPPTEEAWALDTSSAVKVPGRKKNWSAPGPDRLANFWWKCAYTLHEGVVSSFQAISEYEEDFPAWFSEWKTSLIPKTGEFTSDNQRPITCLSTMYKCFTSCLLVPTDKHLDEYDLMEGAQKGARAGCIGTVDNLLIDRTVALDCHRRRRNLSMAWIDAKKAYDSVDHGWLNGVLNNNK